MHRSLSSITSPGERAPEEQNSKCVRQYSPSATSAVSFCFAIDDNSWPLHKLLTNNIAPTKHIVLFITTPVMVRPPIIHPPLLFKTTSQRPVISVVHLGCFVNNLLLGHAM